MGVKIKATGELKLNDNPEKYSDLLNPVTRNCFA